MKKIDFSAKNDNLWIPALFFWFAIFPLVSLGVAKFIHEGFGLTLVMIWAVSLIITLVGMFDSLG